ncbi:hypothetical protein T03_4887 [Trichinella britovi]|uniref:Uncharacterized protein n=1 Tax=Trichinella britovi TaxID=45882 RepID=A0A0V1DI90_TRIBR|nr:hypothetical protein T03_4887 [Trichinella britovi]
MYCRKYGRGLYCYQQFEIRVEKYQIGSKAICSLDRWSSKAISRRQGNATDKKSTMPIPLLTTTDRSVVNNSGRLLIG